MAKFYPLQIKEIKKETPSSVSILFEVPSKLNKKFSFYSGQYIILKTEIDGKEIRRSYSICSSPSEQLLKVIVKKIENGLFSSFANSELKEGDVLDVSRPEGKFILKPSKRNAYTYLGITAGSGITPLMAMIKTVLIEEPKSNFILLYGNKRREETIFKEELLSLSEEYKGRFSVHYAYSQEEVPQAHSGRINNELLGSILTLHKSIQKIFLCGPNEMMERSIEYLKAAEFSKKDIFSESFVPSKKEGSVDFNETCDAIIQLDEEEFSISIPPNKTILDIALENGIDAPFSCQGGVCSSCVASISEGSVSMESNSVLSDEEIEKGLILTCQAKPISKNIKINYDETY